MIERGENEMKARMVIEIEREKRIRLYDGEIRYIVMGERREKNHEPLWIRDTIMITMIQYRDAKHDTTRMLN